MFANVLPVRHLRSAKLKLFNSKFRAKYSFNLLRSRSIHNYHSSYMSLQPDVSCISACHDYQCRGAALKITIFVLDIGLGRDKTCHSAMYHVHFADSPSCMNVITTSFCEASLQAVYIILNFQSPSDIGFCDREILPRIRSGRNRMNHIGIALFSQLDALCSSKTTQKTPIVVPISHKRRTSSRPIAANV